MSLVFSTIMYKILMPILFVLPPELAHRLGMALVATIGFLHRLGLWQRGKWATHMKLSSTTPFGRVSAPLGLAAGFDKNAKALWGWQALGFGFVEVGTVTPRPQTGNLRPRLFRFGKYQALVNRMGFNNIGAKQIAQRIRKAKLQGLRIKVGGNIGKGFSTSLENAAQDYRQGALELGGCVDYLVINVSSPNTPGLRDLQNERILEEIVTAVKEVIPEKPLFIKVAPDNFDSYMTGVMNVVAKFKIEGLICGNTLANHASASMLKPSEIARLPTGGLSGRPLLEINLNMVATYAKRDPGLFIIGVGGITAASHGDKYFLAGARLIQLYSGLVFEGPSLIKDLLKQCVNSQNY